MSTTTFLIVLHVILAICWVALTIQVQYELSDKKSHVIISAIMNFLLPEISILFLLVCSPFSHNARYILKKVWYHIARFLDLKSMKELK